MTDEQIEKALECCAQSNTDCDNCSYRLPDTACVTDLQINALAYISRLKAENAILQEWKRRQRICNETNTERIMQLEDEKVLIRKETAREILQILYDESMEYGKSTDGIKHMAQKYGVEIEE